MNTWMLFVWWIGFNLTVGLDLRDYADGEISLPQLLLGNLLVWPAKLGEHLGRRH